MAQDIASTKFNSQHSTGLRWTADRLDSWKEIASYLGREVRTVQLWEKRESLPIHRHFHKQLGSVFAFRSELDAWRNQASDSREPQADAAAGPFKTPKSIHGRKVLRVQSLRKKTMSHHQAFCDAIMAKTVMALERVNPGQLIIDYPPPAATRVDSQDPLQCIAGGSASDYVLNWDVEKYGDSLRLNAELTSSEDGAVVWSHVFRCQLSDLDEMCDYWAEEIVQCAFLTVTISPAAFPTVKRNESNAREAYLRGRYFWNQRTEESLRKALQCFEVAVQKNPDLAMAYSGIADSFTLLSFYEIVPPFEAMPAARRAAQKAIQLDPDLAEGHASLADILFHFERNWQGADCEYRRAIQCDPGYATGYRWYANLLAAKGLHEAAHIAIMHSLDIDPVSPITLVRAGVISHLARRFDEAIEHYKNALDLDPNFIWTHMYLAQALEQMSRFKEAIKEFEIATRLAGGSNCALAMEAHAYAIAGDKGTARQILNLVKNSTSSRCMPSYDIAAAHAALGESRQMSVWLNRACDERNMKIFTLIQDPRFDRLRQRPEFKEVVDHVGLAHYDATPPSAP